MVSARSLKRCLRRGTYFTLLHGWLAATSRRPVGTNVFEREWDALILLDTCRVDALREVAGEYEFLGEIGSTVSVGSTSAEWIANTFRREYSGDIASTAYVSANAFSERVIEDREYPLDGAFISWDVVQPDEFLLLDQAWRYQPDHPYKHMLPEDLTDRTITLAREYHPERLIIHYSQPHKPYIANARAENRSLYDYEVEPFATLRRSNVDYETVWESYLDNLRLVLNEVAVLLENLDAGTVAISADHGESFGEYGGVVYGHPCGVLHPHVKRVPWTLTTASDTGAYVPDVDIEGGSEKAAREHLEDLGYL